VDQQDCPWDDCLDLDLKVGEQVRLSKCATSLARILEVLEISSADNFKKFGVKDFPINFIATYTR